MRELDFGDYNEKLSRSGREALAAAIEESRKREQNYLAAEHLFLAVAKIEREVLEQIASSLQLKLEEVVKDVAQNPDLSKQYSGKGLKITFSTKSIFRLAWINAHKKGRSKIEALDLLYAIFQEGNNIPVEVLRLRGVEPERVIARIREHWPVARMKRKKKAEKKQLDVDFGDYNEKLGKSSREVIELAIEEVRRRKHQCLTPEHILFALVAVEKQTFENLLRDKQRTSDDMILEITRHLEKVETGGGGRIVVTSGAKSVFRHAWISCFQNGRNKVTSIDLLYAVLQEENQTVLEILQHCGIKMEEVEACITERLGNPILRKMRSIQLPQEKEREVRDAVSSGEFYKAYGLLCEFYNREYERIRFELEGDSANEKEGSYPWLWYVLRIAAAVILALLLLLTLLSLLWPY